MHCSFPDGAPCLHGVPVRRIPYEEMQGRKAKPYLLGQQQRPSCVNCKKDELWSHFCQFKSHGPVCPQWDQDHLFETLMGRCAWAASLRLVHTSSTCSHMWHMNPCSLADPSQQRSTSPLCMLGLQAMLLPSNILLSCILAQVVYAPSKV